MDERVAEEVLDIVPDRPLRASVVIPAHDEERILAGTLTALARQDGIDEVEVIVSGNGCSDRTVDIARGVDLPQLTAVIDSPIAGKAAALNRADARCRCAARIYLDADVILRPGCLRALLDGMNESEPLLVFGRAEFDTAACSWAARAFHEVYAAVHGVWSFSVAGVYGLNAAARTRFSTFPESLMADDFFVKTHFSPVERRQVDGFYVLAAPRDVRNLLQVRTRIAIGNGQIQRDDTYVGHNAGPSSRTTARALLRLLRRHPRAMPKVVVYTGIVAAARILALFVRQPRWGRDLSNR